MFSRWNVEKRPILAVCTQVLQEDLTFFDVFCAQKGWERVVRRSQFTPVSDIVYTSSCIFCTRYAEKCCCIFFFLGGGVRVACFCIHLDVPSRGVTRASRGVNMWKTTYRKPTVCTCKKRKHTYCGCTCKMYGDTLIWNGEGKNYHKLINQENIAMLLVDFSTGCRTHMVSISASAAACRRLVSPPWIHFLKLNMVESFILIHLSITFNKKKLFKKHPTS